MVTFVSLSEDYLLYLLSWGIINAAQIVMFQNIDRIFIDQYLPPFKNINLITIVDYSGEDGGYYLHQEHWVENKVMSMVELSDVVILDQLVRKICAKDVKKGTNGYFYKNLTIGEFYEF